MSRSRRTRSLAAPIASSALVASMALLGTPSATAAPDPFISVATNGAWTYPGDSYVFLGDWAPGSAVEVTIDVPPLGSIDESYSVTIDAGGQHGFVRTPQSILPADTVVAATDGGVTKELAVPVFRPEHLNADTDVIAGVAGAGTVLQVVVPDEIGGNPPLFEASVTTLPDGTWSVATAPFDLLLGQEIEVRAADADGDVAYTKQIVRTPRIVASVTYAQPGGPPEYLWVDGFVPGTQLHLAVDREPDGTPEWTRDLIAGIDDEGSNLGSDGLLSTGSRVTASGGGWTKVVDVVEVRIEYANEASDVIAGVAPNGSDVDVAVWPTGGGPPLWEGTVTSNGWWRADVAPFDLIDAATTNASISDADGDVVSHGLDVMTPTIDAYAGPGAGMVGLMSWPLGTPFTMTVDLDGNGSVERTFTELQPGCDCVPMIPGEVELVDGSIITVTADHGVDPDRWNRQVTVEGVYATGIDFDADLVFGTAPYDGRSVWVDVSTNEPGGPPASLPDVPVWDDGSWTGDFSGTFDLQPGMGVVVHLAEPDGDRTSRSYFEQQQPVNLWAWPTTGLWDGRTVSVYADGLTPGTQAFVTVNAAADPTTDFQFVGTIDVGQDGSGSTSVDVPRWVGGTDCADAPGTCILVVADQPNPFGRNATVPLTFARLDLYRFTPSDPNDPSAGGTVGDPVGDGDVAHLEWVWVVGSGFQPYDSLRIGQCGTFPAVDDVLCRSMDQWVFPDDTGGFATAVQLGRNVFAPSDTTIDVDVDPAWDLRDGQTVVVTATGLPQGPWGDDADCGSGTCFVGVTAPPDRPWPGVPVRSDPLSFSGDPEPVHVWIGQALEQQLSSIIHVNAAVGAMREVVWDHADGTLLTPYTATARWLDPGDDVWDPAPVEDGRYDCADQLTPVADGQEPVHCSMLVVVTEGDAPPDLTQPVAAANWTSMQFARFDLTATVTSVALTGRAGEVRITGTVTCTGFMPEQYLVHVEGTITQTSGKARKTTTVVVPFATDVICSGTMLNPGTSSWTVIVSGPFVKGPATVALDATSPGFTRVDDPFHVVTLATIQAPPKKTAT